MQNFFIKHEIKNLGTCYEPKIWNEKIARFYGLYPFIVGELKLLTAMDEINENELLQRLQTYVTRTEQISDIASSTRVRKNLDVLKVVANSCSKSKISQELFNEYTGWGGLREAIYTPSIYKELKCYLNDDEINSIKKTLSSAYYTPELLVRFIWATLVRMGISDQAKGDERSNCYNILEPATGTGVFFNHIPKSIRQNSYIDAIELDYISCKLLSKLHSDITVTNTGFEGFNCNDNKYDLIIGNPPYGGALVNDVFNPNLSHLRIHNWFVAKSAKMLKDNGIIAMILPQFFLDAMKEHARDIIHESGVNLISAYRLPDNLFADAKVTVDIVFLQKTEKQVEWQATRRKTIGENSRPMNEYFFNNPHHILGDLQIVPMYGRMGITCKSNGDLRTQLLGVYSKIKKIFH